MLKVHTSYKECKIKDFVTKAIQNKIKLEQQVHISKNIPNAETIKTFEESDQGIGITSFNSKEDFFKHLDKLQMEVEQELVKENK
jgi:putative cell wall-binding protein